MAWQFTPLSRAHAAVCLCTCCVIRLHVACCNVSCCNVACCMACVACCRACVVSGMGGSRLRMLHVACCVVCRALHVARCMLRVALRCICAVRRHGHRSNGRLTAEVPRACQRLAHIAHRHVRPLPNGGRDDRMLSVPPIPYVHAGTLFASLRPLVRIAHPGATRDDPMPSVPLPWAPTSRFI